jgi:hypothetical protein
MPTLTSSASAGVHRRTATIVANNFELRMIVFLLPVYRLPSVGCSLA